VRAFEAETAIGDEAGLRPTRDGDPVLVALCGLVGRTPDGATASEKATGNARLRRVLQIVGPASQHDEATRGNPPAIEPLIAIAARRLAGCVANPDVMILEDVPEVVGFSVYQIEDWAGRDEAFREIFERVRDALVGRMFRATLGSELHPSIGLRALSATSRRWNERAMSSASAGEDGSRSSQQQRRGVVEVHIPALAEIEDAKP